MERVIKRDGYLNRLIIVKGRFTGSVIISFAIVLKTARAEYSSTAVFREDFLSALCGVGIHAGEPDKRYAMVS